MIIIIIIFVALNSIVSSIFTYFFFTYTFAMQHDNLHWIISEDGEISPLNVYFCHME